MSREIEVFGAIFMLLSILIFSVFFGLYSSQLNFDIRDQAAGNTVFLNSGDDLQAAIDSAGSNDAIFLNPGSYTTTTSTGFTVTNKKIRILGSGSKYSVVNVGGVSDYVFNIKNSDVSFESVKISGAKKDGILIDNGTNSVLNLTSVDVSGNTGTGLNSASQTTIKTSTFDQNGDGIVVTGATNITNTVIKNSAKNAINIASNNASQTTLQNVLLTNNKGTAIAISGSSKSTITNITAANNGAGIIEASEQPSTIIKNSIVQGSTGEGITLKNANSTVTYSNSFQNTTSNYSPASLSSAQGNLSATSAFVGSSDFKLTSSSTAKNNGDPQQTDSDGTRIDMGAFGGNPNLVGANSVPVITSTPTEYVKPGEAYNYEIIATDADGNNLSYIALNNNLPRWLTLNGNKLSGTPSTSDIGYYGILMIVSDRNGGNVVQPVSINVLPEARQVPNSAGTPTPTATPTVQITDVPTPTPTTTPSVTPKITLVSPTADSVFSKDNNEIKWTLNSGANVDSYEIKYSTDNQNFTTITTLPGTVTSYKWAGVSDLTSGKYVIRIEAKDTSTPPVTVGVTSNQFEVNNQTTADSISITKNTPEDNDVTDQKRPLIQVEFKSENSDNVQLDLEKTFMKVNGENVEYKTTNSTIYFEPQTDFTESRISVEVELVTVNGGKASKQWGFNIASTTNPQDTSPTVTNEQTILGLPRSIGLAILGFLVIVLLLLILYFVVRFINTLRDQRQGNLEAEFTEYYDSSALPASNTTVTDASLQDPNLSTNSSQGDMSQYYSNDQAQVDPNQVPQDLGQQVDQNNAQTTDIQDYENQQQYQEAPVDQTMVQSDSSMQQTQDYQDPNQAQVDNQLPQQQAGDQQVNPDQAQLQNNNKQYIDDLKQKYGIDPNQTAQNNGDQSTNPPSAS